MSGALLPIYRWQMFYNGSPAAGAKLYSYLSGTSTPQPLYADAALGTPYSPQPIEADANGVFPIMYMAAVAYRIEIKTSAGVTIFAAQDNIYDLYQLFTATAQTANTVYAGPTSGSAAAPTFRALVQADIPAAMTDVGLSEGRLTLTSGTPVTTGDVTAATTVYYTPYVGDRISLYNGATWDTLTFTEKSIAVPATTATAYDVWAYNNSGVVALELTAWTNVTTRATALTTQNGIYVKSGTLTRRYLGSFVTTGVSGQTEDSAAKRYLYNYYHQKPRSLTKTDTTASWTYTLATWQQANAAAGNQVAVMVGVVESPVVVSVIGQASNTNAAVGTGVGIGYDSTTPLTNALTRVDTVAANAIYQLTVPSIEHYPSVGLHTYVWCEVSVATGTTTWYGNGTTLGGVGVAAGLRGSCIQ